MQPSKACTDLIKQFEGFYAEAYLCPAGVPTIGWGTTAYPNGAKVKIGEKCTVVQAQEYLDSEVKEKAKEVAVLLNGKPFTQHQFDALVSFAYNLGTGALKGSTLLKKALINPNDISIANYKTGENNKPAVDSCEFLKWVRAGGVVYKGLVRRRAAEADLYKG